MDTNKRSSLSPPDMHEEMHNDNDRHTYSMDKSDARPNTMPDSEMRYHALFNNIRQGIAVYRAIDSGNDFIIEDFNPAAEEIEKCRKEQIVGRRISEVFPGARQFGLMDVLKRVWSSGRSERFPVRFYEDDRVSGWRDNYVYTLPTKEIVVLYSDETERKVNEEKNRQINQTLAAAQEMAGLAYWGYDIRADRVEWSDQMYRLLHRAPDRGPLVDDEFKQIVHTDDWEMCIGAIRKAIHEGEHYQVIMRIKAPDCVLRWFSMQCHPHKDETGRTIRLDGIIQDITELKEAESARENLEAQLRQSQKLEAIGTMTAGIAHDFNNILGIIVGNAELASDGIRKHSEEQQNLDEILQAALRGKEIIKQLLSFNKKSHTNKHPVDLTRLVKESLHFVRVAVPSNIRINHTPLTTPQTIFADAGQIHQVLMNLCTNAAHAMEPAGGVLEIKIQAVTTDQITIGPSDQIAPGDYVCLSVADTGCGIEPACVERVFDPYFTTKDVGKGSGLGLAVVHGILRKHDAHIRVESAPNHGSCFTIFFPPYREPLVDGAPPVEQRPLVKGSESILLVDDEKALVAATAAMLSRLGYRTTLTTDSREALRLFHTAPDKFDLVISDMVMPDMNGDLLSKKIKEIRPDVPILICTGYSDKIDQAAANELGVQVVEKPLTRKKLAALMREMLDRP